MVTHLRRAKQRVAQDLAEIARKHVGKDRGAFDQSAIAVAGFLAGDVVPVDQNHAPAALLQVQGGAHADHARTQDEYVGLQFRHPALRKFTCLRARLMVNLAIAAPPCKPARSAG
jgi:hypothetical protein